MTHNEDITPEEYEKILSGEFIRMDQDEEGYSMRVFRVDGKEYKVY